jgi:hypothetical protein
MEKGSVHTALEKYGLEIHRLGGRRKAAEIVLGDTN